MLKRLAGKLVKFMLDKKLVDYCATFGHKFGDHWIDERPNEYGVFSTCSVCWKTFEVENVEEAVMAKKRDEYITWFNYLTRR